MLEGLDEILTVTRLGLPKELRRALACTNIVVASAANVKRWRSASMALRWTAAAMQEAAKGFRRLKAHKQLPRYVPLWKHSARKPQLTASLLAKPPPRNVNLGNDRPAMFNKKADILDRREEAMEKLGTYRVMEFRAVCRLSNIHATSTECAALRAKFKRVFAGTGTKREVTHVLALLKRVREAAKA